MNNIENSALIVSVISALIGEIETIRVDKIMWSSCWKNAYFKYDRDDIFLRYIIYIITIFFPLVLFPLTNVSIFLEGEGGLANIFVFIYWPALIFVFYIPFAVICDEIIFLPSLKRLLSLHPTFFVELKQEIEHLPTINPKRLKNDIWGGKKHIIISDTPREVCTQVLKFFLKMQKTVNITAIQIERCESWPGLRAICFYTRNGTEYFDGCVVMKYSYDYIDINYEIKRAA